MIQMYENDSTVQVKDDDDIASVYKDVYKT